MSPVVSRDGRPTGFCLWEMKVAVRAVYHRSVLCITHSGSGVCAHCSSDWLAGTIRKDVYASLGHLSVAISPGSIQHLVNCTTNYNAPLKDWCLYSITTCKISNNNKITSLFSKH